MKRGDFLQFLSDLNEAVWGLPMLIFILLCGTLYTFKLKGIQITKLVPSLKAMFQDSGGEGDLSPFKSACVSLAATIGTGNIIGVAGAIAIGGPGAIFWMWAATMLCLPLRFIEGYLGFMARRRKKGGMLTGAFLYIEKLKSPVFRALAPIYAFLCLACSLLGMGTMVQSRSMADAAFSLMPAAAKPFDFYIYLVMGIVICVSVYSCISRGVTGIGGAAALLVPVMLISFCGCGIATIAMNAHNLPAVLSDILESAFTGSAAMGGFGGATLKAAISIGVSRGVFTNESGLGTAAFSAGASTGTGFTAGLAQMAVAFVDTMVVCSISALAILTTGAHIAEPDIALMAARAFTVGGIFPAGKAVVAISLILFSFASILGMYYYGRQSLRYLTNGHGIRLFNILFVAFVFAGCIYPANAIWDIADILNGLMAFINIPALLAIFGGISYAAVKLSAGALHKIKK